MYRLIVLYVVLFLAACDGNYGGGNPFALIETLSSF